MDDGFSFRTNLSVDLLIFRSVLTRYTCVAKCGESSGMVGAFVLPIFLRDCGKMKWRSGHRMVSIPSSNNPDQFIPYEENVSIQ